MNLYGLIRKYISEKIGYSVHFTFAVPTLHYTQEM